MFFRGITWFIGKSQRNLTHHILIKQSFGHFLLWILFPLEEVLCINHSFTEVEWVSLEHNGCCSPWSLVSLPWTQRPGRDQGTVNPAGPGKAGGTPVLHLGLHYKRCAYTCSDKIIFYTQSPWPEEHLLEDVLKQPWEGLLFVIIVKVPFWAYL